jgi:hypothetical protein
MGKQIVPHPLPPLFKAMSYTYLLELYKTLESRKKEITHESDTLEKMDTRYTEGRESVIEEFRAYLSQHYDKRLPRRLQKK